MERTLTNLAIGSGPSTFLQTDAPTLEDVETQVLYRPARHVGGDFYDFHSPGEGKLGICVADVVGKGAPAAVVVAETVLALRKHYPCGTQEVMREVDHHLVTADAEDSFVTMIYGVLDVASREFTYANAGHMPPIVVKRELCRAFACESADPPLGIGGCSDYAEKRIALDHGDLLVLYSDGVTDAIAPKGDGIGEFCRVLGELDSTDLELWRDELASRLAEPVRVDDITVVAVRISV